MRASVKKTLNIISYTFNVLFIVILIIGLSKQSSVEQQLSDDEYIKSVIVERERADIPLYVQRYDKVHSITIDSMVLTQNVEPYAGYLITTWDYDEKQELSTSEWAANDYEDKYVRKIITVYVPITDISLKKNGEVSWNNNWLSAYMSLRTY